MKKEKSLSKNMLLNLVRGALSVLFPLITFPYVSRVIGVESLGMYTFSSSVISYVALFAGLGINVYAIREGARLREDKNKLTQFASEVFTINIWSTIISYAFFFVLLFFVPHFKPYQTLLIILSLQVFLNTIGIEWIYSIYEDYLFVTVRAIVFQLLSIICMFVFVRPSNNGGVDGIVAYAAITVVSNAGANLINFFYARKYCSIKLLWRINLKKHFRPILILFVSALTITIYVSSDTTILGFLCSDYEVGLYGVSVKIYTVIKTLLSSAIVVSIPRLSSYLGSNDKKGFAKISKNIYLTLLTFLLPAVVGLIVLRKEIVLMISGEAYLGASTSLFFLAIAMFFCMGAYFWGQCILVTNKRESSLLVFTIISALTNIVLNFILIPIMKETAAAITTVIAEAIAYLCCMIKGRTIVSIKGLIPEIVKIVFGCIFIGLIVLGLSHMISNGITLLVVSIPISFVSYLLIQFLLGNKTILSMFSSLKTNLRKMLNWSHK